MCRNMIARWPDTHTYALARPGSGVDHHRRRDDAMKTSRRPARRRRRHRQSPRGLLGAPRVRLCPPRRRSCRAYHVHRRGLRIAQDSGNRQSESNLAVSLSRLAATHGDPMYAFDYLTNAGDPQPLSRSSHTQGLKFRVPVSVLTSPGCPMGHETETNRLWCRSASPLA